MGHQITVEGVGTFDVAPGTKLVKAIEMNGVDISHRCGGNARCTTCRVKVIGEDPPMEKLEHDSLEEDGVLGQFRLSCQIRVDRDLEVAVLMRASDQGWEPGPEIED